MVMSLACPMPADSLKPGGIYIHIPFCAARCRYCDFFSTTAFERADAFVDALLREMDLLSARVTGAFDTVYIGGGTPSVLSPGRIARIIGAVFENFRILPGAEVSVEANPDSASAAWLESARRAGVTRVSIGVQSFDNRMLAFLGRIHRAKQAKTAVATARSLEFDSVSLDIMYGMPGQTDDGLCKDLETAISLLPDHLSCYMLSYEKGTPLSRALASHEFAPLPDENCRHFFEKVSRFLVDNGFYHYEISNFAKGRGHVCRHNIKYWERAPYAGLGPSAHSYDGKSERRWNFSDLDSYITTVKEGELPVQSFEKLSVQQRMMEAVYLGFRTSAGVSAESFRSEFGVGFESLFLPAIEQCNRDGLLERSDSGYTPTLRGMLFHETLALRFTALIP